MKTKHYRFNRKNGTIFLESESGLTPIGSSMRTIILFATEPTHGKPFVHLPAQDWVQLCFIDPQGNWSYGVLNSGITNALLPWIQYRGFIESNHFQLNGIVTTIGFYQEPGNDWFDYEFKGLHGKPGLAERMRSLISSSPYPLQDPDLIL